MSNKRSQVGQKIAGVIGAVLLVFALVACGGTKDTIKIGLNGASSKPWEHIKKEAAKENINLELVFFADYIQPNRSLAAGELDVNAFQSISFLNVFNKENKNALTPLGTTFLSPMGIYSQKVKTLDEIPNGGKVTLPNDPSNQGRALQLLAYAKVITLKPGAGETAAPEDIISNPKNLEIIPMAANALPPTLGDSAIAVINNNIAIDAGYFLKDAIFHEDDLAKAYLNVIVVKTADKDNPKYKRLVELYQTEEVKQIVLADTKNNTIPTFVPIEDVWKPLTN
ncbi:MAG: MetQ/NlpA family ABC transporter substrate-binding protein [Culicoidibacterales bacterium]